jgi:dihydroneopterin aldolase
MTTIALEGMQFFANHGYYEEEQATHTYFIVDVYVQVDDKVMRKIITVADDLTGTVNYEMIYEICKMEMKKTTRLIETLAQRIHDRLKMQFPFATKIELRLSKKNPPLAGVVDRAYVYIGSDKDKA